MSAEKPIVDYAEMTPAAMLEAMGDDAMKWAEAFCQTMRAGAWKLEEIDESLMVAWFANAIEHSDLVRQKARAAIPAVRNSTEDFGQHC